MPTNENLLLNGSYFCFVFYLHENKHQRTRFFNMSVCIYLVEMNGLPIAYSRFYHLVIATRREK